jgi:hypothetical protein
MIRHDTTDKLAVLDSSGNETLLGAGGGGGITGITWGGDVVGSNAIIGAFANTTVGSTGKHATLQAAVAAQATVMVFGNSTETGDTTFTTDTYVFFTAGADVNLGANQFKAGANNITVKFFGVGSVTYTNTLAESMFDDNSFTGITWIVDGVNLTNTSAVSGTSFMTSFSSAVTVKFRNCKLTFPNYGQSGFTVFPAGSEFTNVEFIGGGANCATIIQGGSANISDVTFSGTFDPTQDAINVMNEGTNLTNVLVNTASALKIGAHDSTSNVSSVSGVAVSLTAALTNATISNCKLGGGTLKLQNSGAQISGVSDGILDATNNSLSRGNISNCDFDSLTSSSLDGGGIQLSNVRFGSGFSITGDKNACVGCTVASGTITVTGTADKTRLIGNQTASAISDSGTNTVNLGNVV